MSLSHQEWLSLSQASKWLGVHPTTLRRWADAGDVPCFRTPGGHRRFRAADLQAWVQKTQTTALAPPAESLVRNAVRLARQEMAQRQVFHEPWYTAFEQDRERQQMRDTGRRLFGLAVQYLGRTQGRESIAQEGQRIGEFYGQRCAQSGISLVDTGRAFFFFCEALLQAVSPLGVDRAQYDAEDVRIHFQLRQFLDQVMYACLAGYEDACRRLLTWPRRQEA